MEYQVNYLWSIREFNIRGYKPHPQFAEGLCLERRLTYWGRDKMAAIFQTTIQNGFSERKYMNFDWHFTEVYPNGQIDDIPALVQMMAWRRPGDMPFSETMMFCLLTHICVTWPQWVKHHTTVIEYQLTWHKTLIHFHMQFGEFSRKMNFIHVIHVLWNTLSIIF